MRVKGALPRMEALKEVVDQYGVTHMAAICAICKSQFTKVLPYYKFQMDQVISIHQLVGDALVLEPEKRAEDKRADDDATGSQTDKPDAQAPEDPASPPAKQQAA